MWMICRSHVGLSTPFHRLLFGLCFFDIISSIGNALSTSLSPKEVSYYVWNASGNMASCNFQGFLFVLGNTGCIYNASLCAYYLAVVKCAMSDEEIRKKIEPFLHGVPVICATVFAISGLALSIYNSGPLSGQCISTIYSPPHCKDHGYLQIPEGYNIPCYRGLHSAPIFGAVTFILILIATPLSIIVFMALVYRSVLQKENTMNQYGKASLLLLLEKKDAEKNSGAVGWLRRLTSSRLGKKKRHLQSRAVFYKGLWYSGAFFLSFSMSMIITCAYYYFGFMMPFWTFVIRDAFMPLQGFYNLLIYFLPRVKATKRRKREPRTWLQATIKAFWSRGAVPKGSRGRKSAAASNKPVPRLRTAGFFSKKNKLEVKQHDGSDEEDRAIQTPRHTLSRHTPTPMFSRPLQNTAHDSATSDLEKVTPFIIEAESESDLNGVKDINEDDETEPRDILATVYEASSSLHRVDLLMQSISLPKPSIE